MHTPFLLPLGLGLALALLLAMAAAGDLRSRTISNRLNAAIALLAPLWWWAQGLSLWPGIALVLLGALLVFAFFAAAFALGAMGGGDVKLLTALALWFSGDALLRLVVITALAGGVLTLAMLALHRWRKAPGRPEIPYGVAIAAAGLWGIANDILTIQAP